MLQKGLCNVNGTSQLQTYWLIVSDLYNISNNFSFYDQKMKSGEKKSAELNFVPCQEMYFGT